MNMMMSMTKENKACVIFCSDDYELSRLQQIQNSPARTVMKVPKLCHITPILRSLRWLSITERIEYKLLSLTYKVLTTTQPPYLHDLISTQRPRSTRSSSGYYWSLLLVITSAGRRFWSPSRQTSVCPQRRRTTCLLSEAF